MAHIYLIAVIDSRELSGFSLALLRHFVRHYLACGLNLSSFRVTLISDDSKTEVKQYLQKRGIAIVREVESSELDPLVITGERQALQGAIPGDAWVINPALEEFIAFPKPVRELVKEMEAAGYDCLTGWLWDRFDRDFLLKEIHPTHPLHLQFPIAAEYTARALFANSRKEVLIRNWFRLEEGAQWLSPQDRAFHPAPPFWQVQVDYYGWNNRTKVATERLHQFYLRNPRMHSKQLHCERLLERIQNTAQGDIIGNENALHTVIRFPRKSTVKFRFIHIPKTAGTTVINIINSWYPGVNRIMSWHGIPQEQRASLPDEPILVGHIPLRYLAIDAHKNALWFTVLRDPIEQAISCYYEAAKNIAHRPPHLQELLELGLEGLIFSGHFNEIWNDSLRFLSGLPKEASRRQAVESAKYNLKHFTLVGSYDNLERFVDKMARILGREPPEQLPRENENHFKPARIELSDRARKALEEITAADREVYSYARQLFAD